MAKHIKKNSASDETSHLAKNMPNGILKIYSYFPCDKANCICQSLIHEEKKKLVLMNANEQAKYRGEKGFIMCPRDKSEMKRYEVSCANCKDVQGYCFATDATLKDWCDFHYVNWTRGTFWRGCMTPHISPVTETLCFECACGQDSRDFRANMTIPRIKADAIEERNKIGREFGQKNSKFIVKEYTNIVIL